LKSASADLSKHLSRTIDVYNRYRSPEVTAKLVKQERDGFTIEFRGALCQSCGAQDYFEDFIYDFEEVNGCVGVEIGKIKQISPESFRVYYRILNVYSGDKNEETLFQDFLQERGLSFEDYVASNPCTKDVFKFHFRTWLFEKNSEKKKV